jgi:hypothetical protein
MTKPITLRLVVRTQLQHTAKLCPETLAYVLVKNTMR